MLNLSLLGVAIGLVILVLLVFKFMHGVFRIISALLSLLVIAGLIVGGIVILDAYRFQNAIGKEPMAYALVQDNRVLTAMVISSSENSTPKLLTENELQQLGSKNYGSLLNKYYKLWLFTPEVIDDIHQEDFDFNGITIGKELLKQALLSDNPKRVLGIPDSTPISGSAAELKMMLFGTVIIQQVLNDPLFIFEEYKKGAISIVKETPLFKFIRYLPLSMIKRVLRESVQTISKKVR